MAASFNPGASARARITDDAIFEQLLDGNLSEIEDFSDDDLDFEPNNLFDQLACEDLSDGDIPNEDEEISHQLSPLICSPVMQPPSTSIPQPSASLMTQHPPPTTTESPSTMQSPCPSLSSTSRRPLHRLRPVNLSSERSRSTTSIQERRTVTASRSQGQRSASTPSIRKRIWKQVPFVDKLHNYLPLPTKPVRRPIEYFRDYIDNEFIERISHCTNLYYLRTTGRWQTLGGCIESTATVIIMQGKTQSLYWIFAWMWRMLYLLHQVELEGIVKMKISQQLRVETIKYIDQQSDRRQRNDMMDMSIFQPAMT